MYLQKAVLIFILLKVCTFVCQTVADREIFTDSESNTKNWNLLILYFLKNTNSDSKKIIIFFCSK